MFEDNQKTSDSKMRIYSKERKTRLEWQKERRYKVLLKRRFLSSDVWEESLGSDGSDYEVDENDYNSQQLLSNASMDKSMAIENLFRCQPLPQFESIINASLNHVITIVAESDPWHYDEMNAIFFDIHFINKMSSFIGSQICDKLKIKIIVMFKDLSDKHLFSEDNLKTLMSSTLFSTLINLIETGSEEVVKESLQLFREFYDKYMNEFFIYVIRCYKPLISRAMSLNWKSRQNTSDAIKENKRQLVLEKNLSLKTKLLFKHISNGLQLVICNHWNESQRIQLMDSLTPVLWKYLSCPDIDVQCYAIDVILVLNPEECLHIYLKIIETFGLTLISLLSRNQNSIIYTILQLFNQMFRSNPELILQNFGIVFLKQLFEVINNLRDNRIISEVIHIIDSIQTIAINDKLISDHFIEFTDYLLLLLLNVFRYETNEGMNRRTSIKMFANILTKYSFKQFVNIFKTIHLIGVLEQMLISNDLDIQTTGFRLSSFILANLSTPSNCEQNQVIVIRNSWKVMLDKLSLKSSEGMASLRVQTISV